MSSLANLARCRLNARSTLQLWLLFMACAATVAVLIAALQRADGVLRLGRATRATPIQSWSTGSPAGAVTTIMRLIQPELTSKLVRLG